MPQEQGCEGFFRLFLWIKLDSGQSVCNWEVTRESFSSSLYLFFLNQLLLLSGHVVTASLSSLEEQNFIITVFLLFFLLHSLFEKLEAAAFLI